MYDPRNTTRRDISGWFAGRSVRNFVALLYALLSSYVYCVYMYGGIAYNMTYIYHAETGTTASLVVDLALKRITSWAAFSKGCVRT